MGVFFLLKHPENMFEVSTDVIKRHLGGWLGIKSRPPIQRHLIKAQYPRVVGSLVGTAAVRIDEIS